MYLKKSPEVQSLATAFPFFVFILLAFLPALSIRYRSILVIICVIAFIYPVFLEKDKKELPNKVNLYYLLLPILLFTLYAISYLYSTNTSIALFNLEKRLSLMAFPVIAILSVYLPPLKNFRTSVFLVLILSCLFLIFKTILYIEPQQLISLTEGSLKSVTVLRREISSITGLHPTYLSIYFLFSCLILVEFLLQSYQKQQPFFSFKNLLILLAILIFLTSSFITAARTPLISFFIALFARLLLSKTSITFKGTLILLVVGVLVASVFFIPSLNHRVKEVFNTQWKAPEGIHHNSTNMRIGIYQCSLETIQKNWLFGVGAGDSQTALDQCFEQFNTPVYKNHEYNTHNQFLGVWLDVGILGLIALLTLIFYGLYMGYFRNDQLQICFFIFMAINMLTENILATQAGILFFMYFYSFFFLDYRKYSKTH